MVFSQNEKGVRPQALDRAYPATVGNLKFKTFGLAFPGMTINSVMTDTVYVRNDWSKAMNLSVKDLPDYITCTFIPETLNPKAEGKIVVTYDAKKKNEYGRVLDHINVMTNDTARPEKRIIISPDIMPDFSTLTEQERANPPVISFDSTELSFGKIKDGEVATLKYPFKNTGKSALTIYSVKASCGCTKAESDVSTIEPGKGGVITATFNSKRKKGDQQYVISVVSNDIKNPVRSLTIKGMVEQVKK
jgi:hypothetical protein